MGNYSRNRWLIYAGVAASSLLGKNGFRFYNEKAELEEARKINSMSADEYLATLSIDSRCRIHAKNYELIVRAHGVDCDKAITLKRELAKCPEMFSKVVQKIDYSSLKLSNEISEEVRKINSMFADEYLATLPINSTCGFHAVNYELIVHAHGVDSDEAITLKRVLAKCPEKFSKVVQEIENSSSKLSNEST